MLSVLQLGDMNKMALELRGNILLFGFHGNVDKFARLQRGR